MVGYYITPSNNEQQIYFIFGVGIINITIYCKINLRLQNFRIGTIFTFLKEENKIQIIL